MILERRGSHQRGDGFVGESDAFENGPAVDLLTDAAVDANGIGKAGLGGGSHGERRLMMRKMGEKSKRSKKMTFNVVM